MNVRKSFPSTLTALALAAMASLLALPAFAAAEGSFQRTLTVTGPVHMDLATGSGDVRVRAGGTNQVQVTGHIRVSDWAGGDAQQKISRLEANPPIAQSGNEIHIGRIDDAELRHNVSIS